MSKVQSIEVRNHLVEMLRLDLIGPSAGEAYENEILPQAPSRWYLTGFLVPFEAPEDQRTDPQGNEQAESAESGGLDDDDTPDLASARQVFFPSSLGTSVLLPAEAQTLQVIVQWGDYQRIPTKDEMEQITQQASNPAVSSEAIEKWQRVQRKAELSLSLDQNKIDINLEESGLHLLVVSRPIQKFSTPKASPLPVGARVISVFLVNHRTPKPNAIKDEAFVFQVGLCIKCETGFLARPNPRGLFLQEEHLDKDEEIADLQYRDIHEHAVGHNVATRAIHGLAGCQEIHTTWLPCCEVEKVIPAGLNGVDLSMENLAACKTSQEVREKLQPLVEHYGQWIHDQQRVSIIEPKRKQVAAELLKEAGLAKKRMAEGLSSLDNPQVLEAFCITNRVMARAARKRNPLLNSEGKPPSWRLFQIAFLLMNLRDMLTPDSVTATAPEGETGHRHLVDLIFFPTGGGKTEAYLGLAAYTLILRRLQNPGISSAGVSVLMRYTLRLLTLDQLGRAATLICALELERQKDIEKLGPWPFEIGLWVGQAATPNRMGKKGDNDDNTARSKTLRYKRDSQHAPSPIPLETCPWCGTKFGPNSFNLLANADEPRDLRIVCLNRRCDFTGEQALPILTVDEPIYRRLPGFIIATVDKFAALPWTGETGALFGKVDRYDSHGFYGPCHQHQGRKLERTLLPPDLIIQDELHLISGPLGTMAGLYETAIEALCARPDPRPGRKGNILPKIVASTATVRRAQAQIRALFGRAEVQVFPPPGQDLRDSFFSKTAPLSEKPGRLYVGVAAQGKSAKVMLLRAYLVLLASAQREYAEYEATAGTRRAADDGTENTESKNSFNPADPYMTLLGYFNSLRELGGSRRIVEDEVWTRVSGYADRKRIGETRGPFDSRKISREVHELTSRVTTNHVAETKRRLGICFIKNENNKEHIDVALATNMISVGLDITRLGLMVVNGQPKSAAEYIQATSRVGRDDDRPGLVVTLLNVHRPRDRSHYERFEAFHESFYRSVEATSVTPFSPRVLDRALAAVVVALARLQVPALTPPQGAIQPATRRSSLNFVADIIAARAEGYSLEFEREEIEELREHVRSRVHDLLDEWAKIAADNRQVSAGLQYQNEIPADPPLLHLPLAPELMRLPAAYRKFKARRSLRDVEGSVNLWARRFDQIEIDDTYRDTGEEE